MTEREKLNWFTESIIGAAIEVHRVLGPGLLESAYEACLAFEPIQRSLKVEQQKPLPVVYREVKNVKLPKDGIRRMVNDFPDSLHSPRALR